MRVVGKFNNQDIRLEVLHMSKTYGGFLLGPSEKHLEDANRNILNDLEGRECQRLFGADNSPFLALPEGRSLKDRLPEVEVFARLMCISPVRGASPADYFSELILIWFQEGQDDPFDKLTDLVKAIDWDAQAQHFYWANL
jgi:hypothetical protein